MINDSRKSAFDHFKLDPFSDGTKLEIGVMFIKINSLQNDTTFQLKLNLYN